MNQVIYTLLQPFAKEFHYATPNGFYDGWITIFGKLVAFRTSEGILQFKW